MEANVRLEAATLYWLLIIGEAATRISSDLKARHPEVPWREIVDLRNLLLHGYDRVRRVRVWEVVAADLDQLEHHIGTILEELGE